jgi:hypothetical protein
MRKNRTFIVAGGVVALLIIAVTVGSAQEDLNGSGWWSSANVQRIGSQAGSAEVIMTAYDPQSETSPNGPYDCGSRTLASFGAGATFYPHWDADPAGSNCANNAQFPTNFEGSAILSASDEIAAIVQTLNMSYNDWAPGDNPYGRALAAYAGVSSPATTVGFPLYKNNHNGEMTTFYIQNAGSANTNLTATFTPCADQGSGTACVGRAGGPYTYNFPNLEPGKMAVIDATLASVPAGNGSYGSLVVTSSGENIAGAVMEHSGTASPATYLKAVAGFSPSQYDTTYYIPQVKNQYPKSTTSDACNSKWSSVMVQNVSGGAVNVTVDYTVNENPVTPARVGTTFSDSVTALPDGETAFFMSFMQSGFQIGDLASATVTADGDVVAMVNEEMRWECTNADKKDLASWPGIPANAAKTKISVPFYKQLYNGKFQGLVVQNVGASAATYELTMTVIGKAPASSGPAVGSVFKFTHTDSVAGDGAKTFVMPCNGTTSNLTPISGDYTQLCNEAAGSGTNVAVVVESTGNIVGVVTEERYWNTPVAQVGDGHSEDAGMYTAIPLD